MNDIITPKENLEILLDFLSDSYFHFSKKRVGKVQLYLRFKEEVIPVHIDANGQQFKYEFISVENPDFTLKCTYEDWLKLASKKLNFYWCLITRRIKISGNPNFFHQIMPNAYLDIKKTFYNDNPTPFEINPSKYWTLPSNVVIINASYRPVDGQTHTLLNFFSKGIREANPNVNINVINLSEQNITMCKGHLYCWTHNNGKCVIDDDFEKIADKIKNADIIVWGFPVYSHTIPASLKILLERMTSCLEPYMIGDKGITRHPRQHKTNQSSVIISTCGFPEEAHFNSIKLLVKQIAYNFHTPIIAEIYRTAGLFLANNPMHYIEYIKVTEAMQQAGFEITKTGKIKRKVIKAIERKNFTTEEFKRIDNIHWMNRAEKNKSSSTF